MVLHVNFYDISGGSAIAANRLHNELRNKGMDSRCFVRKKNSADNYIYSPQGTLTDIRNKLNIQIELLVKKIINQKKVGALSIGFLPDTNLKYIKKINPDLVHLHWINGGFLNISSIAKINPPKIWTLHDMWPICGTEHYSENAYEYREGRHKLSLPNKYLHLDIDGFVFKRKIKYWENINNLVIVCPSKWLSNKTKESYIFQNKRIETIYNGIDLNLFKPLNKYDIRNSLGLTVNKKIILFGVAHNINDLRKGSDFIPEIFKILSTIYNPQNIEILIFGGYNKKLNIPGYDVIYLGNIFNQEELAKYYAVADIFLLPSREDNLPNTAIESLACGTPVISFNIGGVPEIISNSYNGYLIEPFKTNDFALSIKKILEMNKEEFLNISNNARNTAIEKFDVKLMARKYMQLYAQIINSKNSDN